MSTIEQAQPTISNAACRSSHVSRGYTDPLCPRCAERVASGLSERFSTPLEIAESKALWRASKGVTARIPGKTREFKQSASRKASHNRWHKARGIVSPDCEHCVGITE